MDPSGTYFMRTPTKIQLHFVFLGFCCSCSQRLLTLDSTLLFFVLPTVPLGMRLLASRESPRKLLFKISELFLLMLFLWD